MGSPQTPLMEKTMLKVHVLYQYKTFHYHLEQLDCLTTPSSTNPADYGLPEDCLIILVLVRLSALGKFLLGTEVFDGFAG